MHKNTRIGSVWRQAILATVLLVSFLTMVTLLAGSYLPVITHAERERPSGEWVTIQMPYIEFHPMTLKSHVRLTLNVPTKTPSHDFQIRYRDAVTSFRVNGTEIVSTVSGAALKLGGYLHHGDNDIDAVIGITEDPGIIVYGFGPSVWQMPTVIGLLLALLAFATWFLFLVRIGFLVAPWPVVGIGMLGVMLRVFYAVSTPVYVRAYDWGGHLAYISYLVDHHAFPHTGEIWQGHQPPLFYLLCTPFEYIGRVLGWAPFEVTTLLKLVPLLLSVGTLLIGLQVILRLFQKLSSRIVGAFLVSAFPALIYFSSQVNNDVLLTFFGFAWFERLLVAVESGKKRHWAQVGLLCGLGLLTKANALPWVAASGVVILFTRTSWRLRMTEVAIVGGTAFATGGFWYAFQMLCADRYAVVANAFFQIGLVTLSPKISEFITFHPIALIMHPSVSVSGYDTRPQYLLETLFRTSQLGSVYFSDDVTILLVFALLLLLWVLRGVWVEMKEGKYVNTLVIVTMFAASALFRLRYPFPTAEHFRYIAVTALPFCILITRGVGSVRTEMLRILGEMTAAMYATFVTIIVLSVLYFS